MSSIFTAPGTSAMNDSNNSKSGVQTTAAGLFNQWSPTAKSILSYMQGVQPWEQNQLSRMMSLSNPSTFASQAGVVGRQAMNNGLDNARIMAAQFGPGSGAATGAMAGALNASNLASNNFLNNLYNPQSQMAMSGNVMNMLNGYGSSALGPMSNLAGIVYGNNPQVGQSPLSSIAAIAPTMAGFFSPGVGSLSSANPSSYMPMEGQYAAPGSSYLGNGFYMPPAY